MSRRFIKSYFKVFIALLVKQSKLQIRTMKIYFSVGQPGWHSEWCNEIRTATRMSRVRIPVLALPYIYGSFPGVPTGISNRRGKGLCWVL